MMDFNLLIGDTLNLVDSRVFCIILETHAAVPHISSAVSY